MTPREKADARRVGQERLAARRRRTWRIRTKVATVAASTFLASFGAVYVHVANGGGPALRSARTTVTTSRATRSTASALPATSSAAQTTQQSRPSAVTTQQS